MERISLEQYKAALDVIKTYEKQLENDKLKIYEGCTADDIVKNETINKLSANKEFHFWVTKEKELPNRNSDGCITYDYMCNFYTLERSRVPYDTFDQAYKNLLKSFKRKKIIQ
jgi:hypothetical protein